MVTTKSGKVQGEVQSSSLPGVKVQKFLNIPYAQAPVGRLRFEKPQARKPWKGICMEGRRHARGRDLPPPLSFMEWLSFHRAPPLQM